MLEKYYYVFLITSLLCFAQTIFAQELQESKSKEILIKESIVNLDSNDIHTAAQAARYLGIFRAKEGVPVLLKVLQDSRHLSQSEHIIAKDKNGMSHWELTDVKAEIITSLGLIGDKRAVPILKKYLRRSPKNSEVYLGNVAWALYKITGKSYKYKDRDGKVKLFQKER